MKPKLNPRPICRPVHYQWSGADGTIHTGHSVVTAKSKHGLRAAFKRFFAVNPHVQEAA